jgi:hypothetical protein
MILSTTGASLLIILESDKSCGANCTALLARGAHAPLEVGLLACLLFAFIVWRRLTQRCPSPELFSSLQEARFAHFRRTLIQSVQNGDCARLPPSRLASPPIGQLARAQCDSARPMRSQRASAKRAHHSGVASDGTSARFFCSTAPSFVSLDKFLPRERNLVDELEL